MSEKLIGINELAEILDVAPSWLYARTRLKGPGTIPTIRLGKYVKFYLPAVMKWAQAETETE
jgi:hypothetical protein